MSKFDAVVIGAGPAAVASAIALRRFGWAVVLVGRPAARAPVSIESLPPEGVRLLGTLGLMDALLEATIGRYDAIWRDGCATRVADDPPACGHHVDRNRLDAGLLVGAMKAGVAIDASLATALDIDEAGARVHSRGAQHFAGYVIDGSGRAAFAARRLGLSRSPLSGRISVWRGLADESALAANPEFVRTPSSWRWIAPLDDGRVAWTAWNEEGVRPASLWPIAGSDMTWFLTRPCAGERYRLVGDAAACLDARLGQGMVFALRSGIEAAVSLLRVQARPKEIALVAADYDAMVVAEFGRYCEGITGQASARP